MDHVPDTRTGVAVVLAQPVALVLPGVGRQVGGRPRRLDPRPVNGQTVDIESAQRRAQVGRTVGVPVHRGNGDAASRRVLQRLSHGADQQRMGGHLDEAAVATGDQGLDGVGEPHGPPDVVGPVRGVQRGAVHHLAGDRREERHDGPHGLHGGQQDQQVVEQLVDLGAV